MGKRFNQLMDSHVEFIQEQKLFFVATAVATGPVNLSPKGLDSLRVLSHARVAWLNVTGSGNETAAHVQQDLDITIDLVQTSCGMAVPYFSYEGDRELLTDWAIAKGEVGLKRYWEEKNQASIDGIPTRIVEKNL